MKKHNQRLVAQLYYRLYLIRRVEEEIIRVYPSDVVKSPVHLSIGQEAISVGVCQALAPQDTVFGTYRGHALYLAKGGDLKRMIAELYGKVTGCARGKGGSMHLIDAARNIMGTSAIVGTNIPIATGFAYAMKYKKSKALTAAFFGDGAVDEGVFHESLNFAALKKLPILFVCENNSYAIHSHHLSRHKHDNIIDRATVYGMPAERIEDSDIFKIYSVAKKYIERIRKGSGPAFIECKTCRWKEHVGPGDDFDLDYRLESDVLKWKNADQLPRLRGLISDASARRIELTAEKSMRDAFNFAIHSAFPAQKELYAEVFK